MSDGTASVIGDSSAYVAKALMPTAVAPNFLQGLGEPERMRIQSAGLLRQYRAGEIVFSQGEPHNGIFVIQDGEVRAYYVSPSGREITLAYWSRGHFVGGPEILGKGCHTWSGKPRRIVNFCCFPAIRYVNWR